LIQLNAHRQVAAVGRQIDEVDRRQQAMLRSEAVAEDPVADRAYRRALDQARRAVNVGDLDAAMVSPSK